MHLNTSHRHYHLNIWNLESNSFVFIFDANLSKEESYFLIL